MNELPHQCNENHAEIREAYVGVLEEDHVETYMYCSVCI